MSTTHEPPSPEGLADLGRQVADDAARLVRAAISLAKAQMKEAVIRFAIGGGLIGLGATMALFFVIFTVATLVEGIDPLDSWPLYVAVGSVVAGAALLMLYGMLPRWIAWLPGLLAVAGV